MRLRKPKRLPTVDVLLHTSELASGPPSDPPQDPNAGFPILQHSLLVFAEDGSVINESTSNHVDTAGFQSIAQLLSGGFLAHAAAQIELLTGLEQFPHFFGGFEGLANGPLTHVGQGFQDITDTLYLTNNFSVAFFESTTTIGSAIITQYGTQFAPNLSVHFNEQLDGVNNDDAFRADPLGHATGVHFNVDARSFQLGLLGDLDAEARILFDALAGLVPNAGSLNDAIITRDAFALDDGGDFSQTTVSSSHDNVNFSVTGVHNNNVAFADVFDRLIIDFTAR